MRIARTNPRLKIEFVAVKRTDDRFPLDPALGELPTLVRAGILYRAEFPVLLKDGDLLALHANQFRAAVWNIRSTNSHRTEFFLAWCRRSRPPTLGFSRSA